LEPGKRYRVRVPLRHVGQHFAAGQRLRVAISTSYWPVAWAPPEPVTLTIHTGGSRLILPVRAGIPEDQGLAPIPDPAGAPPLPIEEIEAPKNSRRVVDDLSNGTHALEITSGTGKVRFTNIDLTVSTRGFERYSVRDGDPTSQRGEASWTITFSRGGWSISSVSATTLTCDERYFHIEANLKAYENDKVVYERRWLQDIPRRLV
jgi:uncharacterized protein